MTPELSAFDTWLAAIAVFATGYCAGTVLSWIVRALTAPDHEEDE